MRVCVCVCISIWKDWRDMYRVEPAASLSATEASQLVGGEMCMWGETVDASEIESTIWPRGGAVAEKLWSSRAVTEILASSDRGLRTVGVRLKKLRCYLISKGVGAAPLEGQGRNWLVFVCVCVCVCTCITSIVLSRVYVCVFFICFPRFCFPRSGAWLVASTWTSRPTQTHAHTVVYRHTHDHIAKTNLRILRFIHIYTHIHT